MDTPTLSNDEIARIGAAAVLHGMGQRGRDATPEERANVIAKMRQAVEHGHAKGLVEVLDRYMQGEPAGILEHYPELPTTGDARDRLLRMADEVIGKEI